MQNCKLNCSTVAVHVTTLLSLSLSLSLSQESSHFISIFNRYVNDEAFGQIKLDRTEAFTHSPDTALKNIKARDINIIIGFFGPENARIVLCKVSYVQ